MDLLKNGVKVRLLFLVVICFLAVPSLLWAEEFKVFNSEEYGFSMKFPATWVKIDKPKGNYYVAFHSPDLKDNFRDRIHVAAHEPVKDPLDVFLKELRSGIKDLQSRSDKSTQKAQQVKILDEGEFKCEVPGAYYFFIQAFEDRLKMWMDIVVVFYKHDQTLLRVSCLASSKTMEQMQPIFNEVLVSVAFSGSARPAAQPSARQAPAAQPAEEEAPASSVESPQAPQPTASEPPPAPVRTAPTQREPRGPARRTPEPPTGIVQ